jgi:hypothetical protein
MAFFIVPSLVCVDDRAVVSRRGAGTYTIRPAAFEGAGRVYLGGEESVAEGNEASG